MLRVRHIPYSAHCERVARLEASLDRCEDLLDWLGRIAALPQV